MKTRNGFVSNSSSSSFVINKSDLTNDQIFMIKNYTIIADLMAMAVVNPYDGLKPIGKFGYWDNNWNIEETPLEIKGYTYMDNFDMHEFLDAIKIPDDKITWREI